jgi:hypothetical protein
LWNVGRGNCAPGITPTTSRVEEKEVEQLGNVEGLFDTALQDANELIGVLQDNRFLFSKALVGECVGEGASRSVSIQKENKW